MTNMTNMTSIAKLKLYLTKIIIRIKKPSVVLSLVSNFITLLVTMGFKLDSKYIMSLATIICSILVTLGILSNPDSATKGYGDKYLICSRTGQLEPHEEIGGKMLCQNCGAEYDSTKAAAIMQTLPKGSAAGNTQSEASSSSAVSTAPPAASSSTASTAPSAAASSSGDTAAN